MKKRISNISNVYIFLWCLYNLQGTLYASGSYISRIILAVILMISIYYFVFANFRYEIPKVLKVLSWLVLIWTVYGFIHILYGTGGRRYFYLKDIFSSLLPVYPIYVFVKQGKLNADVLRNWGIVFVLIGIAQFYRFEREELAAIMESGGSMEEITNNSGYIMLSLLPLLPLYYKKPVVQYVLLGIILFYILIGMKRGAIIIGVFAVLWMFYNQRKINKGTTKQLLRNVLTIVIFFVMIYSVQKLLITSEYFNFRLEQTLEGKTSGRDGIYSLLLSGYLNQTSIFALLFGNGAFATLRLFRVYAHNDWLEIAINNGFWMIVLYLVYWVIMFRTVLRVKQNIVCFLIIGLFFIIYFFKSFISMSYFSIPVYATSALGYALAVYGNEEKLTANPHK